MDSAELAAITLPRSRFRGGFAIDEVDDLLDQCVAALRDLEQGRSSSLSTDAIVVKQFRHVRFGEAYDADAVDDLLDRVVVRLRELQPDPDFDVPSPAAPTAEQLAKDRRLTIGMKLLTVVLVLAGAAMLLWKLLGS